MHANSCSWRVLKKAVVCLFGLILAIKIVIMYSYKFNRGVEQLGSSSGS